MPRTVCIAVVLQWRGCGRKQTAHHVGKLGVRDQSRVVFVDDSEELEPGGALTL